jgi:hypothetical protein
MCRECEQPLQPQRLAVVPGRSDIWQVELRDYPVIACPIGHERREALADFNVEWYAHLSETVGMYQPKRGLLNRRYECRACREELQEPSVDTVDVDVRAHPGHEFRVRITGPLVRCRCGTLTIRDLESDNFAQALIDALERQGLRRF